MLSAGDCQYVLARFFYCLDESRYDDLLAMFTPDAVWFRQNRRLVGHDTVRAALMLRSPTAHIRHVITNVFALGSAGEPRFGAYMTAYKFDDGTQRPAPVPIDRPFKLSKIEVDLCGAGAAILIREMTMTALFEDAAQA